MGDLSKPPRPDEIMRSLAAAIRERRFEYVQPLLSVLARRAPADAEAVYGAMLAVLPEGRDAAGAVAAAGDGYAGRRLSAAVSQGSLFDHLEAS